jgi:hypothetical protein
MLQKTNRTNTKSIPVGEGDFFATPPILIVIDNKIFANIKTTH